ncbi:YHS domain-containing protein, partial [candidate division WOR-3 bacterium]|nr:YHS domain-containing protein [candidate division WOR-3 bacterium]
METEVVHVDPVCKMKVTEGKEAGTTDYQGTRYYFCNANCKTRFDKEPERFLKDKDEGGGMKAEPESGTPGIPEPVLMDKAELAATETASLSIGGMSCASCALSIEKA